MAPIDRQYEMLGDGIADMAILPTNEISQIVVLNAIADLPYHSPEARAASVALWETYKTHFEEMGEYGNLVVLGTFVLPGRQILGLESLATLQEVRGSRLWTPAGQMADLVAMLGAVPNAAAFPDLYETVARGQVDGLLITPGSARSAQVLDLATHQTLIDGGLGSVSFAVAIRRDRWDALSEEQRQAVLRAAEGLGARVGGANDNMEVEAQAEMGNIETMEASAELMEAIEPIAMAQYQAWKEAAFAKGLEDPDAAIVFYREAMAAAMADGTQ
ncbi:hypothetical protein [Pelagibacterium sp.]|uniref:hypothetical protein n=1 Tax=Pelagibacterium sp. TaxID=1967288 RepID=UPI003BACA183